MASKINIGDTWKTVAGIKINIGDAWKTVVGGWINIGDTWKSFYSPLLTWPGSTHTEADVVAAGGSVYNTGTYTIGKFTASTPPAGWTQAANWQTYNNKGSNGDACGRFVGTCPTTFSNTSGRIYYGTYDQSVPAVSCASYTTKWHCADFGGNTPLATVSYVDNSAGRAWGVADCSATYKGTTTRTEIGCY